MPLAPVHLLIPSPRWEPLWPAVKGSPGCPRGRGRRPSEGWAWFRRRWWRRRRWAEMWPECLFYFDESLYAWPGGRCAWTSWSTPCTQTSSLLGDTEGHQLQQHLITYDTNSSASIRLLWEMAFKACTKCDRQMALFASQMGKMTFISRSRQEVR